MIDVQDRRLLLGVSVTLLLIAIGHEWSVQRQENVDEALRHELAEVRRMATDVDRLALNARSSTTSYDALADTLHTLRGHERRLVLPTSLSAAREDLAKQIESRADDIDAIKRYRSEAQNTERYLYDYVEDGEPEAAWVKALNEFLLVPETRNSTALKAVTPTEDATLMRHVDIVTSSRIELNERVTNILKAGLGELASKLESAHAKERRAKHSQARNIRLGLLTLLALLQLWVFRQG